MEVPDLSSRIPGFEGAQLVRQLKAGPVSDSWLLETDRGLAVLRCDRPQALLLGLDRARESRILQRVGALGLGPELLFSDPERGLLLTRALSGRVWQPADLGQAGQIEMLGSRLRQVHELDPQAVGLSATGPDRFQPLWVLEHYAGLVDGAPREVKQRLREALALARDLYADSMAHLCHHDPHCGNLVGNTTPTLLDWEYAALGEPLLDLAVVIEFHGLDQQQAMRLLGAWGGKESSGQSERLAAFRQLYRHLEWFWQRAVDHLSGVRAVQA